MCKSLQQKYILNVKFCHKTPIELAVIPMVIIPKNSSSPIEDAGIETKVYMVPKIILSLPKHVGHCCWLLSSYGEHKNEVSNKPNDIKYPCLSDQIFSDTHSNKDILHIFGTVLITSCSKDLFYNHCNNCCLLYTSPSPRD